MQERFRLPNRACDGSVLALLDFRPGIPERHGSIEHELARLCVRIYTEVAESLELKLVARRGGAEARLERRG